MTSVPLGFTMPIKKRTNVPSVLFVKETSASTDSKPNHSNLVALEQVLKDHDMQVSDAYWSGDIETAEFHEEQAALIRQRIAEGEIWETLN